GIRGVQTGTGTIGLPYSCYMTSLIQGRAIRYMVRASGTSTPTRTTTMTPVATPPCQPAWVALIDPGSEPIERFLYGVAAIPQGAPTQDLWAVGWYAGAAHSQQRKTLIEHWDGTF